VNRLKLRVEAQPGQMYLDISNQLDSLIKYYMIDLDAFSSAKKLTMNDILKRNKTFFTAANNVLAPTVGGRNRFFADDTLGLRFFPDSSMLFPKSDSLEFISESKEYTLEKAINANNVLQGSIGTSADYFYTIYDIGYRLQINQKNDSMNLDLTFSIPHDRQTFKKVEFIGIIDAQEKIIKPEIFQNTSDNSSIRLKIKTLPAGKYFLNFKTNEIRGDGSIYDMDYKKEFVVY
jgi:hypothetical protein